LVHWLTIATKDCFQPREEDKDPKNIPAVAAPFPLVEIPINPICLGSLLHLSIIIFAESQ